MGNVVKFQGRLSRRLPGPPLVVTLGAAFVIGAILTLAAQKLDLVSLPQTFSPQQFGKQSSQQFSFCGRGTRTNCVIDGDTFYFQGEKIRIADIDTPEMNPARCDYERDLGVRATRRLHELLNAGPIELSQLGNRDQDRYDRKLRIVLRDSRSLGDILVSEGLARTWAGRRQPWCVS